MRPRARTASVVVPFPRMSPGDRLELGRLVPSGRVLLLSFAALAGTLLALLVARETSLFGVGSIEVTGASPGVARQVERALEDRKGASLVGLDLEAARVGRPVPLHGRRGVASTGLSRTPFASRRPRAPCCGGASGRRRVRPLRARSGDRPGRPAREAGLARMWVAKDVTLESGAIVDGDVRIAVAAVTPLAGSHFPGRVVSLTTTNDQLTLRLRSGLELRLGGLRDVGLKLAVAARVIPRLPAGARYLDVSVPDRPVAGPQASTLRSRSRVRPPACLEGSVDIADKESVPWLRIRRFSPSHSSMRA